MKKEEPKTKEREKTEQKKRKEKYRKPKPKQKLTTKSVAVDANNLQVRIPLQQARVGQTQILFGGRCEEQMT